MPDIFIAGNQPGYQAGWLGHYSGGSEVLSYAIKTQLKATKGYYYEYFFHFAGSLWHKGDFHSGKNLL